MKRIIVAVVVFFVTISALLLFNKESPAEVAGQPIESPDVYLAQIASTLQKTPVQTPSSTPTATITPETLIPSVIITATSTPLQTQTSTPTPTTVITPTMTPTPTATATTTQSGGGGGIAVASLTSPVAQKQDATIKVQTDPVASCTIEVTLPSGTISTSKDLSPKTTDQAGQVVWSWGINWNTKPGTAIIKLSCKSGDKTYSGQTSMQITASQ